MLFRSLDSTTHTIDHLLAQATKKHPNLHRKHKHFPRMSCCQSQKAEIKQTQGGCSCGTKCSPVSGSEACSCPGQCTCAGCPNRKTEAVDSDPKDGCSCGKMCSSTGAGSCSCSDCACKGCPNKAKEEKTGCKCGEKCQSCGPSSSTCTCGDVCKCAGCPNRG